MPTEPSAARRSYGLRSISEDCGAAESCEPSRLSAREGSRLGGLRVEPLVEGNARKLNEMIRQWAGCGLVVPLP